MQKLYIDALKEIKEKRAQRELLTQQVEASDADMSPSKEGAQTGAFGASTGDNSTHTPA